MWFLITLIVLFVFFLVGFILTKVLFMPEKGYEWIENEGETVSFKSGNNTLEGRLINKEGKKGTIIFAHGMGLSSRYYRPEALHFAGLGYKVFIFEYRGYGKSTGTFLSFRDVVKDIVSASSYLGDDKFILIGHSMGGYGVLSSLDEMRNKVKGVVAYAPFRSPFSAMDVCALRMGKLGRIFEVFLFPFQILIHGNKANRSAIDAINNSSSPILVIQGDDDKEVSIDGCSIFKKKDLITNKRLEVKIIDSIESNGHVTVVRKKGSQNVNEDTIVYVDEFLSNLEHSI